MGIGGFAATLNPLLLVGLARHRFDELWLLFVQNVQHLDATVPLAFRIQTCDRLTFADSDQILVETSPYGECRLFF